MSYEIAKSFSLDLKTLEMRGVFASNNVYPRTFTEYSTRATRDDYIRYEAFRLGILSVSEMFKVEVLQALLGGDIKLYKSVSVKYRYALHKVGELIRKENPKKRYSYWENAQLISSRKNVPFGEKEIESDEEYKEKIDKLMHYTNYFYFILEEKVPYGEYIVEVPLGYYYRELKYGYKYTYSKSNAKVFDNKWEAELAAEKSSGKVIDIKKSLCN